MCGRMRSRAGASPALRRVYRRSVPSAGSRSSVATISRDTPKCVAAARRERPCISTHSRISSLKATVYTFPSRRPLSPKLAHFRA